jgi:hypothetical protein
MIDLKLNEENDLEIRDFDLQLIDSIDQVVQNLKIRLKFILGEWYLDITQGIPYYEDIFIKSPNQITVETVFKNEILSTDTVEEITRFRSNFQPNLREFNMIFSVIVEDQELEVSV